MLLRQYLNFRQLVTHSEQKVECMTADLQYLCR